MAAPSLPDRPASIIDDSFSTNLYVRATREYVNREFAEALETLSRLRARTQADERAHQRAFILELATLDALCSSSSPDRRFEHHLERLRSYGIFQEAQAEFEDDNIPVPILRQLVSVLCKHGSDKHRLQDMFEEYLSRVKPEGSHFDQAMELYVLKILPHCQGYDEAGGYIDSLTLLSEERRSTLASSLISLKEHEAAFQAREAARREASVAARLAAEENAMRRAKRKSITGSRKGTRSGGTAEASATSDTQAQQLPPAEESVKERTPAERRPAPSKLLSRIPLLAGIRVNARLAQVLLLLCILFGAAGRQEIRDRLRAAFQALWRTISMGMKVSYV
ncbi:hypothetical protein PYCC9005_000588 [Savitreella phatthalungensis]